MNVHRTLAHCALALTLAVGCLGCAGTAVRIPNVPARTYDASKGRRVTAESTGFQLLLWIPIGINERHQKCYDDLERQAPGHFITDVKIQDSWTYAFVGTLYSVKMEATAFPYVSP
ncbi:MAG: hypothetical protein ACYTG2_09150 [Planctomycetota bacterium]|jgi:hypothetical protein